MSSRHTFKFPSMFFQRTSELMSRPLVEVMVHLMPRVLRFVVVCWDVLRWCWCAWNRRENGKSRQRARSFVWKWKTKTVSTIHKNFIFASVTWRALPPLYLHVIKVQYLELVISQIIFLIYKQNSCMITCWHATIYKYRFDMHFSLNITTKFD